MATTLLELPSDALHCVLERAACPTRSLCRLTRTCRQLRDTFERNDLLWSHLSFAHRSARTLATDRSVGVDVLLPQHVCARAREMRLLRCLRLRTIELNKLARLHTVHLLDSPALHTLEISCELLASLRLQQCPTRLVVVCAALHDLEIAEPAHELATLKLHSPGSSLAALPFVRGDEFALEGLNTLSLHLGETMRTLDLESASSLRSLKLSLPALTKLDTSLASHASHDLLHGRQAFCKRLRSLELQLPAYSPSAPLPLRRSRDVSSLRLEFDASRLDERAMRDLLPSVGSLHELALVLPELPRHLEMDFREITDFGDLRRLELDLPRVQALPGYADHLREVSLRLPLQRELDVYLHHVQAA